MILVCVPVHVCSLLESGMCVRVCVYCAVDLRPSEKCGLDVPDSWHWVISFQVSVLVINFIPLRQGNMIEIA